VASCVLISPGLILTYKKQATHHDVPSSRLKRGRFHIPPISLFLSCDHDIEEVLELSYLVPSAPIA